MADYIETILINGPVSTIEVKEGTEYVTIDLGPDENTNSVDLITEVTTLDVTNKSYISSSELVSAPKEINILGVGVAEEVTYLDKGIAIDALASPSIHGNLNGLVDSVLSRRFTADGGNIVFWISIRRLNPAFFRLEIDMLDNSVGVNQVHAAFDDYEGPEPEPDDAFLLELTSTSGNTKIFRVDDALGFSDPDGAIGEVYTLILDFIDVGEGNIDSVTMDIEVKGLTV